MSKIRVGIVGYGNLGKASGHVLNSLIWSWFASFQEEKYQDYVKRQGFASDVLWKYKDMIDVMVLCGGCHGPA